MKNGIIFIKSEKQKGVGDCMKLKIVLEESDEGGYTVYVPSLPGCISEGDTEEEAIENIKEAIELYLESIDDDVLSTAAQRPVVKEITV